MLFALFRLLFHVSITVHAAKSGLFACAIPVKMEECTANLTMPSNWKNAPGMGLSPSQGSRPNILLILSDQQRFDFDGMHESIQLDMPNFKRLANEGVRFTAAFSPSPLCAPCRTCLAVGRQYHETVGHVGRGGFNDGPPKGMKTFYSSLRDAGYHTMTCGKDDLMKGPAQLGLGLDWDRKSFDYLGFSDGERSLCKGTLFGKGKGQPNDQYGDFMTRIGNIPTAHGEQGNKYSSGFEPGGGRASGFYGNGFVALHSAYATCRNNKKDGSCPPADLLPDEGQEDSFVGRKAIQLLHRRPKDKPFFLQVNFPSPHDPYTITKCMSAVVAPRKLGGVESQARRGYAALCEMVDLWLGKIMDELEAEPAEPAEPFEAGGTSGRNVRGTQAPWAEDGFLGTRSSREGLPLSSVPHLSGEGDALDPEWYKRNHAGRRRQQLPAHSTLANTLVCFSSDHGDLLGDGGEWGKQRPGQGSVGVPLVCRGGSTSGILRGATVRQPVSLSDLAATFVDLAGAARPSTMTSRSLLPILRGLSTPYDVRPVVVIGLGKWALAVTSLQVGSGNGEKRELKDVARSALAVSGEPSPAADNRTWVQVRASLRTVGALSSAKWKIFDPTTNIRLFPEAGPVKFGQQHEKILQTTREAFVKGKAVVSVNGRSSLQRKGPKKRGSTIQKRSRAEPASSRPLR